MKTTSRILRATLCPPRLRPDRLVRPRLLAQLDRGLAGHCTLVCAPAGYGKTTLLAQWIERTESGENRYDTEPDTSWFLRAKVNVLSVLPIDWLL